MDGSDGIKFGDQAGDPRDWVRSGPPPTAPLALTAFLETALDAMTVSVIATVVPSSTLEPMIGPWKQEPLNE